MNNIYDQLYDQLRRDEGDRATAYQDSRGVWTVGVGHNLAVPLSWSARDLILHDDVLAADTLLRKLPIAAGLSEARYMALLNLTFNQGLGWVGKNPKMYAALQAGNYVVAAEELLDGPYKDQVGARADRIAQQLREGVWV